MWGMANGCLRKEVLLSTGLNKQTGTVRLSGPDEASKGHKRFDLTFKPVSLKFPSHKHERSPILSPTSSGYT